MDLDWLRHVDVLDFGTVSDGEILVIITRDPEVTPADYDCYSRANFDAWETGSWEFVTVTVVRRRDGASASLGAVEWGTLSPDRPSIELSNVISDPYIETVDPDTGATLTTATMVGSLIAELPA